MYYNKRTSYISNERMFCVDIKTISNRISELCKDRGWSYYRLTKEAGLNRSNITSIVKGENMPTLYTIDRICAALDITLSDFFQDKKQNITTGESFLHLWEQLPESCKEKVMIYMYGLLKKSIEGETLNDL